MPELTIVIAWAALYAGVGLIVAVSVEEHVGSRTAAIFGLIWPATLAALVARRFGWYNEPASHTPTSTTDCTTDCDDDCESCFLAKVHDGSGSFSVRIVDQHGPGDELGRVFRDPLTNRWVAAPADTTQPILGMYDCGYDAIEALLATAGEMP